MKEAISRNVDRLFVMEMGDANGEKEAICIKHTRLGGDRTVIHSFFLLMGLLPGREREQYFVSTLKY